MYLNVILFVFLFISLVNGLGDDTILGRDFDYSLLAGEAEEHKKDILTFLEQSRIKEQYKNLYNNLLSKLMTSDKNDRPLNVNHTTGRRDNALPSSTRRIVSGRNTSIAAVPWQASLREKSYPVCGGSVITDSWLITAAHCLLRTRASDLSVRLGSSWKNHGGEMYDVKECYVHPKYSSKTKINDVGLLRLYTSLRFSSRILPLRVVAMSTRLRANVPAIVSGWGKLREGGPSATYLQSSTIKTIAMKLCRQSGLSKKAIVPAPMFCAGSFASTAADACQGDSGGPIVYEGVLIGVVSWGLGCARGNFPGVYTRLSDPVIYEWIHDRIAKNPKYNCSSD